MEFITDINWNIADFIVAIVAIVATWIVASHFHSKKALQYEILSNNNLISVDSNISSDIEISYKDLPVQSLSLILLRFSVIGNSPILLTDYIEPIQISISPNAIIGEAFVEKTMPKGINVSIINKNNHKVELKNVMLNPRDQFYVKILAIDNDGSINCHARIAGIPKLEQRQYYPIEINIFGIPILFTLKGWFIFFMIIGAVLTILLIQMFFPTIK